MIDNSEVVVEHSRCYYVCEWLCFTVLCAALSFGCWCEKERPACKGCDQKCKCGESCKCPKECK